MATNQPSAAERLTTIQEQMATLRNESIALDAEEAKDVLLSKIQEKATQEGYHAFLKNADIIRTWAKSAGLRGILRLGKAALIHKVALFRDLPYAKETAAAKDVGSAMPAPVMENSSHLALFTATEKDEMPIAYFQTILEGDEGDILKEIEEGENEEEQLIAAAKELSPPINSAANRLNSERPKMTRKGEPIEGTRVGSQQLRKLVFGCLRYRKAQVAANPKFDKSVEQDRPAVHSTLTTFLRMLMFQAADNLRMAKIPEGDAMDVRAGTLLDSLSTLTKFLRMFVFQATDDLRNLKRSMIDYFSNVVRGKIPEADAQDVRAGTVINSLSTVEEDRLGWGFLSHPEGKPKHLHIRGGHLIEFNRMNVIACAPSASFSLLRKCLVFEFC
ncbi:hypothetical protein QFC21_006492 [Naganishia friedmannii]|uniref:Uncharacterized protein n=1 Tax=Naganishia friedmannii TaxID=89922 RepID=A0ACC2V1G2_9TREE|nr:hypothetical protein QFC21_006492 [Naganishia friedmannii]